MGADSFSEYLDIPGTWNFIFDNERKLFEELALKFWIVFIYLWEKNGASYFGLNYISQFL